MRQKGTWRGNSQSQKVQICRLLCQDAESCDEELEQWDAVRVLRNVAVERVNPEEEACARELEERVERVLKTLPYQEAMILRKRFGIGMRSASTLEEIGVDLGRTPERVRQIQEKALRKLRHLSRWDILEGYA